MSEYHDPYLNTVKRALDEKERKEQKIKFRQQNFLKQDIDLNNYLPENLRNILGTALFILLPYVVGITFLFFIIAQANIETYHKIDAHSFLLAWTIGYELIAFFLLLMIIKSAINFHKIRNLIKEV